MRSSVCTGRGFVQCMIVLLLAVATFSADPDFKAEQSNYGWKQIGYVLYQDSRVLQFVDNGPYTTILARAQSVAGRLNQSIKKPEDLEGVRLSVESDHVSVVKDNKDLFAAYPDDVEFSRVPVDELLENQVNKIKRVMILKAEMESMPSINDELMDDTTTGRTDKRQSSSVMTNDSKMKQQNRSLMEKQSEAMMSDDNKRAMSGAESLLLLIVLLGVCCVSILVNIIFIIRNRRRKKKQATHLIDDLTNAAESLTSDIQFIDEIDEVHRPLFRQLQQAIEDMLMNKVKSSQSAAPADDMSAASEDLPDMMSDDMSDDSMPESDEDPLLQQIIEQITSNSETTLSEKVLELTSAMIPKEQTAELLQISIKQVNKALKGESLEEDEKPAEVLKDDLEAQEEPLTNEVSKGVESESDSDVMSVKDTNEQNIQAEDTADNQIIDEADKTELQESEDQQDILDELMDTPPVSSTENKDEIDQSIKQELGKKPAKETKDFIDDLFGDDEPVRSKESSKEDDNADSESEIQDIIKSKRLSLTDKVLQLNALNLKEEKIADLLGTDKGEIDLILSMN